MVDKKISPDPDLPTPETPQGEEEQESSMPKRSRLKHTLENNSKKTLYLSLAGIIIVIVLLLLFGVPFLVKFAEIISREDKPQTTENEELVIILPPYLNPAFEATNSAEISIPGTAEDGEEVQLYLDGKQIKEIKISNDRSFEFTDISLKEGKNRFSAKVVAGDRESRSSDPFTITYLKEAPTLSIEYPTEGQTISHKDGDRLQVEGTTSPQASITINGSQAIVDDEGKFKYYLPVKGGDNSIKAVATDEAGNKTELERKFTYNQ